MDCFNPKHVAKAYGTEYKLHFDQKCILYSFIESQRNVVREMQTAFIRTGSNGRFCEQGHETLVENFLTGININLKRGWGGVGGGGTKSFMEKVRYKE